MAPSSSPSVHWKCSCRKYTRLEGIEHKYWENRHILQLTIGSSGFKLTLSLECLQVSGHSIIDSKTKQQKFRPPKCRFLINVLLISFRIDHMKNVLSILQEHILQWELSIMEKLKCNYLTSVHFQPHINWNGNTRVKISEQRKTRVESWWERKEAIIC